MNSARLCHNFSSVCRFTKRIKNFISSVGVLIITAGWYTGPATMVPSLPTNGMPAHRRWFQYHRQMVHQPASMSSSSPPNRLPNRLWYSTDCRSIELRHDSGGDDNTAVLKSNPVVMNNTTADFKQAVISNASTNDFHQRQS